MNLARLCRSVALAIPIVAACSVSTDEEPDYTGGAMSEEEARRIVLLHMIKRGSAPKEWDRAVTRPLDDATAARDRLACKFKRGALPAESLGAELPVGDGIPIKHVFVLMQENRSFDSYFGHLAKWARANLTDAAGQPVELPIDAPPDTITIPKKIAEPNGETVNWLHAEQPCFANTNHEWGGSHLQWNGGKMNGWVDPAGVERCVQLYPRSAMP